MHIERRTDGRLQRHDLGTRLPEDDLCLRAARSLQQASGTRDGADISIDKQVPWGAGLGGGSSDAATTLLALNRLWGLNWPRARLLELAVRLGADVPFFVGGHNAWVEGIGEQLSPLTLAPMWLAVLKPPPAIPTAEIFGSPLLVRDTPPAILLDFLARHEAQRKASSIASPLFGRNDLQASAESVCGEVTQALQLLKSVYGNSRMTGSGSAVFAFAGTGAEPMAPLDPSIWPADWAGRMCRSLAVHPLRDWAGDGPLSEG